MLRFCSSLGKRGVYSKRYVSINATIDYDGITVVGEDAKPLENEVKDVETSFRGLGVTSRMLTSLQSSGITEPNAIQRLSLPVTFKRGKAGSCVIQSETGSGKTLSYLLPALQDIRPGLTSLIIVPTRELAVQVCYWAEKLTGTNKNSRRISLLVSGRTEEKLLRQYKDTKPHVVIGTPKLLTTVLQDNKELELTLQRLVLDETDALLDPLHAKAPWRVKRNRELHLKPTRAVMESVLKKIGKRRIQLICTSATIPLGVQEELSEIGWEGPLPVITTNKLPKQIPQSIKHTHIRCNAHEEKGMDLARHFKENGIKSALVFVHRDDSIKEYTRVLKELGVAAEALYMNLDSPINVAKVMEKFESGEIQLMVGNEETVRGLDFPFLETVYLMEVPRSATEYLHSSGRVGRCGREGQVVVFVETPQEIARMKRVYERLVINNYEKFND